MYSIHKMSGGAFFPVGSNWVDPKRELPLTAASKDVVIAVTPAPFTSPPLHSPPPREIIQDGFDVV